MNISKPLVRTLRSEIEAAIKAIGNKHGVSITLASSNFSTEEWKPRMIVQPKGVVEKIAASSPVEKGARYRVKNTIFTVKNFHPNKPKFSIETVTQTGKIYFTTPSYLQSGVKL